MSKDLEIAAIQRNVDEARDNRALADALSRLNSNPDFNALINVAYFKDEAIRLVHLRSNPGACEQSINKQMDAISGLSGFFRKVRQDGQMAEKAIRDGESMIEQMHSED